MFMMELSAPLWARSKLPGIVRRSYPTAHCDGEDTEVVRLKNGVVKIEDFESM